MDQSTLSPPVIDQLARTTQAVSTEHKARRALIETKDVRAELALDKACRQYGAGIVGVWSGQPIRFDLLLPSLSVPSLSNDDLRRLGYNKFNSPEVMRRELQRLQYSSNQASRRLLGYVGFLTFNEQDQAEKEILCARWHALPDRPPLPIRANVHDQQAIPILPGALPPYDCLSDEVSSFLDDLGRFQRKWQLQQMVAWDLLMPQGPLTGMPLGVTANLLGPDQLVSTLPAFYDPPSSEDERKARRNRQRQSVSMAGLSGRFPLSCLGGRGDDASAEEGAFRLWLIEKTVRTRYGSPRGIVARLMVAFGDILECGQDRIKQLRQMYLPFLGVHEPS